MGRLRRASDHVRQFARQLGRVPSLLVVVAALSTAVMYCSNSNEDAHPDAARGDGVYRPVMARGDGHMHFLITRSIVFDHDFNFDNDLARFGDPWAQPRTVTGRKNVMQQIGPSLVWAPVLALAHGAALVANAFGAHIPTHGYTMFHQRILYASSVLFAWLAIGLGILVAIRLVGGSWGPALAGVASLLGTSLLYYSTYMPSYAHAMDAAASAAFLAYWALTLDDLRWRRALILGVLLGIAAMVRVQDVAFGVVVALELGVLAVRALRQPLDPGAPAPVRSAPAAAAAVLARGAVVLGVALALHLPQLYVWKQMYGSWLTTPQGPGQMRYGHALVLELLFSSRNGWLSTTPIAYLGVVGLLVGAVAGTRLGRAVRFVCFAMLLAVATQVYTNAITYEWWSGASFGQRRLCSVTIAVVVGLAVLLRAAHVWLTPRVPAVVQRAIAIFALGYLVAWNVAWTSKLRHGLAAGRDNRATCCADAPRYLAWLAKPVYAAIGNPFELPASALFAARHGTDLRRWDVAVGSYALVPGVLGYIDGTYRAVRSTWGVAAAGGAPYVLDGFGAPQSSAAGGTAHAWRWTTAASATTLLPLLMPEPHRVTVPIAANVPPGVTMPVVVRCNGREVLRTVVGADWTTIAFLTDGLVGDNVLVFEGVPLPYFAKATESAPAAPVARVPVALAVGNFGISLP